MEVGPITPTQATDKALAAWAAAVEAIHADGAPADAATPLQQALATPQSGALEAPVQAGATAEAASMPLSEPALPGADSDPGHEGATLQSLWRAPALQADTARLHDKAPVDVPAAEHDLSLTDALLAPATLTGLRTEQSLAWSLPTPPSAWQPSSESLERRRDPREPIAKRRMPSHEEAHDAPAVQPRQPSPEPPQTVLDADDESHWQEALSRTLQGLLDQLVVPPALLAAREQWQRGRCVVLACPQRPDPSGSAWAHVLWPQPPMAADGKVALRGLRVEARLQWLAVPPVLPWCHARLIREHHPRHGRQVVLADAAAIPMGGVSPCEIQLGPLAERVLRRCEVRVHVPAAQRFWAALGRQWSVLLVVCARPLLAAPTRFTEAMPC